MLDSNQPVQENSVFGEAMLAIGTLALGAGAVWGGRKLYKGVKGKWDAVKPKSAEDIIRDKAKLKSQLGREVREQAMADAKKGDFDGMNRQVNKGNFNMDGDDYTKWKQGDNGFKGDYSFQNPPTGVKFGNADEWKANNPNLYSEQSSSNAFGMPDPTGVNFEDIKPVSPNDWVDGFGEQAKRVDTMPDVTRAKEAYANMDLTGDQKATMKAMRRNAAKGGNKLSPEELTDIYNNVTPDDLIGSQAKLDAINEKEARELEKLKEIRKNREARAAKEARDFTNGVYGFDAQKSFNKMDITDEQKAILKSIRRNSGSKFTPKELMNTYREINSQNIGEIIP